MLTILISSFIATFGFGILFNIKGNKLVLAAIGGTIGGVVYTLSKDIYASEVMALFFSSMAFSLYSEVLARICKTPVTTFIICALIPLVPGKGMYQTMVKAVEGDALGALQTGVETISYAGALALGIILVSTIMRFILKKRAKKV